MHIIMVGVNYRTAPLELREVLAVPSGGLPATLDRLTACGLAESVLISTCNRTEIYAIVDQPERGIHDLSRFLSDMSGGMAANLLRPHLYEKVGPSAIEHLFQLASGLDSMVIGETQVLGQVRDAYEDAKQNRLIGKVLHHLFLQAITTGKRAQTETRIGQNAVSISYAAVELAKKVFRSLAGRRCLAIGAGETAKLTVRHLQASGVGEIVIANRTIERAEALAGLIGGRAITINEISSHLADVDMVISSTGAPGIVVTRQQMADAMRQRKGRPIFLFDIAVPRDIDPTINGLDGAFLYNIDDLHSVITANMQERLEEAKLARKIIAEETEKFRHWLAAQQVVPTIRRLRDKVDSIRQDELSKAMGRLPDLTDRERATIEAMTVTMMNKILNEPTQQLKGMEGEGTGTVDTAIDTVSRLFDLPKTEILPNPKKEGG